MDFGTLEEGASCHCVAAVLFHIVNVDNEEKAIDENGSSHTDNGTMG